MSGINRSLYYSEKFLGNLYAATWGRGSQHSLVDVRRKKRISILKLDHIGDVLMITPALEILSKAGWFVRLGVGPWAQEISVMLEECGLCQEVEILDSPRIENWRSPGGLLKALHISEQRVRQWIRGEALFDAREYFPGNGLTVVRSSSWAIQAAPKWYPHRPNDILVSPHNSPNSGCLWLNMVSELIGVANSHTYRRPVFLEKAFRIPKGMPTGNYVCICLESRDYRRALPLHVIKQIITTRPGQRIILVGSKCVSGEQLPTDVLDFRGKTTLRELFYLVSNACEVLSVDSLVAHIALSAGNLNTILCRKDINHRSFPEDIRITTISA